MEKGAQRREGKLTLNPNLVPSVLGQDRQSGDVQPELARLAELAQAGTQGEEVVARHVAG